MHNFGYIVLVMKAQNPSFSALQEAIHRAGSQSALGRLIGKSQPHIYKMLNSRNAVRPEHCLAIERATGVKRQDLRPDDWHLIWPELAVAETEA